jgi:Family of unknown function (DUF6328)
VADSSSAREESEEERLDRNLNELLQELRVALPGVQVLFAFLLVVPFQQGFTKVTPFQERVYFVALLCTAICAALLISPTAYHRMLFRKQQKHELVFLANRMALIGLGFLALALTATILLITDVVFGATETVAVVTALAFLLYLLFWFLLPLRRRLIAEPD